MPSKVYLNEFLLTEKKTKPDATNSLGYSFYWVRHCIFIFRTTNNKISYKHQPIVRLGDYKLWLNWFYFGVLIQTSKLVDTH